jgi:hypothetical protein
MGGPQYYFAGGVSGNPAPPPVLGRRDPAAPEPLLVLSNVEDVREATRRATLSAHRLLSIFTTYEIEPLLYETEAFLELIKRFLLNHTFAKVRVLTHKPVPPTTRHRMVALSRRLSGHIEIRAAHEQFAARQSAMFIADANAIVYRSQVTGWDGVAGFNQPPIARLYLQEFDEMWVASVPRY